MTTSDDHDRELDGRTVRPYLLTGGRTRSVGRDLPIEALVAARPGTRQHNLDPEHREVLAACQTPIAIAEVAVALGVPVGVARVLVSDLAAGGHIQVFGTATQPDVALVRRLIAGVKAI